MGSSFNQIISSGSILDGPRYRVALLWGGSYLGYSKSVVEQAMGGIPIISCRCFGPRWSARPARWEGGQGRGFTPLVGCLFSGCEPESEWV